MRTTVQDEVFLRSRDRRRAPPRRAAGAHAAVLDLQRDAGNAAVTRLLERTIDVPALQRQVGTSLSPDAERLDAGGEVKDDVRLSLTGVVKDLPLVSVSFGLERSQGPGERDERKDVHISFESGEASAKIGHAMVNGKPIKTGAVAFHTGKLELTDCIITSFLAGQRFGGERTVDSAVINCAKVEFVPQT